MSKNEYALGFGHVDVEQESIIVVKSRSCTRCKINDACLGLLAYAPSNQ